MVEDRLESAFDDGCVMERIDTHWIRFLATAISLFNCLIYSEEFRCAMEDTSRLIRHRTFILIDLYIVVCLADDAFCYPVKLNGSTKKSLTSRGITMPLCKTVFYKPLHRTFVPRQRLPSGKGLLEAWH